MHLEPSGVVVVWPAFGDGARGNTLMPLGLRELEAQGTTFSPSMGGEAWALQLVPSGVGGSGYCTLGLRGWSGGLEALCLRPSERGGRSTGSGPWASKGKGKRVARGTAPQNSRGMAGSGFNASILLGHGSLGER